MPNPIIYDSVKDFKTNTSGWKTEKEFVDFIELNIELFTREIIGAEYLLHKREWYLSDIKRFGANKPRMDLMIETKDFKRVGIECKLPTQSFSDLSRTMSQLLAYGVIAEGNNRPFHKMYILTTQYDQVLEQVIQKYELPIDVVVFSKTMRAESTW